MSNWKREFKLTKKICFIVTDASSFNVLFRDQLEYIRDNSDFNITLICGGSEQELGILRKRQVGRVLNVKFQRKPHLFDDARSLIYLTSYLLFNRFDIVVYSTPKALLLGSIASFATLQNKKIAVVHGRVYENFIGLKRYIFRSLDKLSFSASDNILFVSNSLFQNYIEEEIVDRKLATVVGNGSFNGVNIDVFKPVNLKQKFNLRKEFSIPLDSFLICIVGRICIDKGIKDIQEIVETLASDNIKFLFVGSFEDESSKNIVNNIVSNGQGYHMPYTSNVHQVFQLSDLHLFLSYREGFGNVAIEAASCNLPTFAYDVVGIKDSVCDYISGRRFKLRDNATIANSINSAANDPDFNLKYSSAREWAIRKFEQKKVWKSYLSFYLNNIRG